MWVYIKWTFRVLLLVFIFAFLHYTLPQRDIVRINGTEVIRQDFSSVNRLFYAQADSGNTEPVNRDLRLINTSYPDGGVMVFRNEDTGFGWPPYFKLDSSNLQAEAQDLASNRAEPLWVAVRHYGWRNEFLSIYPNAVGIRQVDGPDTRLIPWLNIVILSTLLLIILLLWRVWVLFRRRNIDPVVEDVGEAWERVDDYADEKRGRITSWFRSLRGPKGKG